MPAARLLHRYVRTALCIIITAVVLLCIKGTLSPANYRSFTDDFTNSVPLINHPIGALLQRKLSNVKENLTFLPKQFEFYNLKQAVKRTDINCTVSKTVPSFPICIHDPLTDKYITGALLSSGVWEPYITKVFQIALEKHPNAILIDIGANIGYYSFLAAGMGHDVIALEPVLENAERFHKGTQLGRFLDNVHLLKNAMSDRHQTVCMTTNKENQGGLRVVENGCDQEVMTSTITMDDLLYLIPPTEAIIKIDIEGYECKAMSESAHFFKRIFVPYIFMEWQNMFAKRRNSAPCPGKAMQQLANTLSHYGYLPYEVRTGIEMQIQQSSTTWRIGDVYWRHRSVPLLIAPL
ncbi:uncharacterized protein LOC121378971 isoform X2 [Gigantopelta aegis]|uniref:uncharacterized protein LOC121378971 isoform X2 n=1 Tax=Gigantopelta aegis TaxID=1735272 RepID=UPI001B8875F1|nr:uncharacterized protein LOC121378971 isoform X2 [Gigantopelta aegis]